MRRVRIELKETAVVPLSQGCAQPHGEGDGRIRRAHDANAARARAPPALAREPRRERDLPHELEQLGARRRALLVQRHGRRVEQAVGRELADGAAVNASGVEVLELRLALVVLVEVAALQRPARVRLVDLRREAVSDALHLQVLPDGLGLRAEVGVVHACVRLLRVERRERVRLVVVLRRLRRRLRRAAHDVILVPRPDHLQPLERQHQNVARPHLLRERHGREPEEVLLQRHVRALDGERLEDALVLDVEGDLLHAPRVVAVGILEAPPAAAAAASNPGPCVFFPLLPLAELRAGRAPAAFLRLRPRPRTSFPGS
mmetsp:Transcript_30272/g.96564  ORF Transcript_30272/g.96564 Transcript_30272/m.96564 type:complete len:316 (-) Transcript_30272:31-978(-)